MKPDLSSIFAPSNSSEKTMEKHTGDATTLFHGLSPFKTTANLNIEENGIMFKLVKDIIFLKERRRE